MDTRARYARLLADRLTCEVVADDQTLDRYAHSASIHEVRPLAVVFPAGAEDVCALVETCRAEGMSLTARGAGSAVAGQAVGEGVVADLSRLMNRVVSIDPAGSRVVVEPGIALGSLNRELASHGLLFSPDPSSAAYCTIGGMIANNAGGAHSVRYGCTRDHVVSLTGVTGDAARLVTRPVQASHLRPATAGQGGSVETDASPEGENDRIAGALLRLLEGREDLVREHTPRTSRNSSGYDLAGATARNQIDLARLITGSEGTLAIVTEATLGLVEIPPARATALVLFDALEKAGEGIVEVLAERPSCIELMSESLVKMIRAENAAARSAIPEGTRAVVILEFDGGSEGQALAGMEAARRRLDARGLASSFDAVTDAARRDEIWSVRLAASPTITKYQGRRRNMRFIEDACVPPRRLVAFLRAVSALLDREGIEAAIFGHAGDSLLHVNPLMDAADPDLLERMESIAAEFTEIVLGLGGTLTGEHGDGRLRTPFLPRVFGPLYPLFGEVKRLFDSAGILNPGIIAGAGSYRMTDRYRWGESLWSAPESHPPGTD